jgi:hypothetical protein
MKALVGLISALSIPLMLLNMLGGIVSGIWLAILGEWGAVGAGVLGLFVSTSLLGFALMPGLLFAVPAAYCLEKGKTIGLVFFAALCPEQHLHNGAHNRVVLRRSLLLCKGCNYGYYHPLTDLVLRCCYWSLVVQGMGRCPVLFSGTGERERDARLGLCGLLGSRGRRAEHPFRWRPESVVQEKTKDATEVTENTEKRE